ncbi:MAG: hypothetical protein NVSMB27_03440 [Ktedonobacteraceae bacterium]
MSILPPISSPYTRKRLAELLTSNIVKDPYPHLLRWLVWFPLLSVEELTRLEQARLAQQKQTRSRQRVAALLHTLEKDQLIAHVVINEPGWPPRQYRYYLTDVGLSVFAAHADPPLSVPRLAQAYAVERTDLIERLARIEVHLVLAELSTRLVAEGQTHGFPLTSFQQPWVQTDVIFGQRQVLRCDAALLLADAQEHEYAFFVHIDTNERRPFDGKQERIVLLRLLNLRHAYHLRREAMPPLLIITGTSRLAAWGALLEETGEQRRTMHLDGAITTMTHLRHSGVHGRSWWPFAELIHGMHRGLLTELGAPSIPLSSLLRNPASPMVVERFSQRRTFTHLMMDRSCDRLHPPSGLLPSYVGKPLTGKSATSYRAELSDALSGTRAEQQEAVALLNLTLSASQKNLLFWLTHHQLLTMHHVATLHAPGVRDRRGVQKQMRGLSSLNLLVPFAWHDARFWHERERYVLIEAALRYMALREGRPATYYLLPPKDKKANVAPALSIQHGTSGLFAQMEHTHGIYNSVTWLLEKAHHEKGRLITWKNAREAIRWYRDPFTTTLLQIRPDAEVIYLAHDQIMPQRFLVEYDRATTSKREYEAKYQSYTDYLNATRLALPPILVITQHAQAAALIRTCLANVSPTLSVIIVLEDQLRQRQPTLGTLLNCSQ